MNNHQVSHIWAQGAGKSAKGSNFFCAGSNLYSYGAHFVVGTILPDGTSLINSDTYSPTTGRHISLARRAVSHRKSFVVPNVDGLRFAYSEDTAKQLHAANAEYLKTVAHNSIAEISRRKNKEIVTEWAIQSINEHNDYVTHFGVSVDKIDAADIEKLRVGFEALTKERKAKEREQVKLQKAHDDLELKVWLQGGVAVFSRTAPTYLRTVERKGGSIIQTSRGAEVPYAHAKRLYKIIGGKPELLNQQRGYKLGHFEFETLSGTDLIIGCHRIPWSSVESLAQREGWAK